MYYEKNSRAFNLIVGLALGVLVGAGLTYLTAPQSGKRTRRRLARAISGATASAGERWDGLSGDLLAVIGPSRLRLRR
jgi:gas vesicle protein